MKYTAEEVRHYADVFSCEMPEHGMLLYLAELLERPAGVPVAWGVFAGQRMDIQGPVRFTEEEAKRDAGMYVKGTQVEVRPLFFAAPQPERAAAELGTWKLWQCIENSGREFMRAEGTEYQMRTAMANLPGSDVWLIGPDGEKHLPERAGRGEPI